MKHIPNMLSCLRIVLIPFFVWQMFEGNTVNAGLILIFSGVTDCLDGFLARRFGWVTPLGKVLDPIADKLTQGTISVVLAILLREYWPFFAILIAKDVVMLVLGGYLLKKGVKIEGARWFGKAVTILFYVVMISIVCFPEMPDALVRAMLTAVAVCAVLAAGLYVPEFLQYRSEINNEA